MTEPQSEAQSEAQSEPQSGPLSDPFGPEEGGGPPLLLPWTLVVEAENWAADLEHGAALPRVGERIEYIADDGTRRMFVVESIVHTLQHASSDRPSVGSEGRGPNAIVNDATSEAPRILRAGLPRVIVRPAD
jgi:hypothetical protein